MNDATTTPPTTPPPAGMALHYVVDLMRGGQTILSWRDGLYRHQRDGMFSWRAEYVADCAAHGPDVRPVPAWHAVDWSDPPEWVEPPDALPDEAHWLTKGDRRWGWLGASASDIVAMGHANVALYRREGPVLRRVWRREVKEAVSTQVARAVKDAWRREEPGVRAPLCPAHVDTPCGCIVFGKYDPAAPAQISVADRPRSWSVPSWEDGAQIAVPLSSVDWQAVHRGEVKPPERLVLPERDRTGDLPSRCPEWRTAYVYMTGSVSFGLPGWEQEADVSWGHVAVASYDLDGKLIWHRGQEIPAQAGPHDDAEARDGATATVLPAKPGTEAPALDERNTGQAGAVPAATPDEECPHGNTVGCCSVCAWEDEAVLCPRCDRERMPADVRCCQTCHDKAIREGMAAARQRDLREFRQEHRLAGLQTTRPVGGTTEAGGVLGRRWLR